MPEKFTDHELKALAFVIDLAMLGLIRYQHPQYPKEWIEFSALLNKSRMMQEEMKINGPNTT